MRILQINNFHYLRGGAEKCYFDTAKILFNNGHDIAFFSMKHSKNKKSRWSKYFIDYVDYEKKNNFIEKIKIVFKIWYNFQAKKNLEKLIKNFKPDIAHLHNIYHHLSPSIIDTLKKYNIPMVMTLHDYKLICPNYNLFVKDKIWEKSKKYKYYKCFLDKCIKNSYSKSLICVIEAYLHRLIKIYSKIDCFISPSEFLIYKFNKFEFKKEIIHLPNPLIDIKNVSNRKEENYILYFGRLSIEKGINDLIKSYSKLNTICKLFIVGSGNEFKKLKLLIEKLNLNKKIILIGYKRDKKLFSLINNAKFVVFPSKWYENAPYSIIEAMSLQKLVICAKVGGIPELIENKKTGFLYDADNTKELADTMNYILKNPEKTVKIGENARKIVKNKNNQKNYYINLLNIYKRYV